MMMQMNTPHTPEHQQTKRVTVPIDVDVLAVFERLAEASGTSVGKAMGTWLADTVEGAEAMAGLMEKARRAPKEAVMELHSYALGLTDVTQGFLDHVNKASLATSKAVLKASKGGGGPAGRGPALTPLAPKEKPKKPAAKVAKKTVTPPVGNTGGKLPSKPQKSVRGKNV